MWHCPHGIGSCPICGPVTDLLVASRGLHSAQVGSRSTSLLLRVLQVMVDEVRAEERKPHPDLHATTERISAMIAVLESSDEMAGAK